MPDAARAAYSNSLLQRAGLVSECESLACHAQLLCGYVTVVVHAAPIWQVVRLANALEEAHLLNCRLMLAH